MNSTNLTIVRINTNDVNEILNLQINNNSTILSESSILEDLSSDNSIYFIAKIDNTTVGYIAANLLYDHIDILSVLVDNEYKRNNIASTLLSYVINYAKEININEILLEVRTSNIPAQKLYEKFGFNKISVRKQYYSDNLEDAIIYKLII